MKLKAVCFGEVLWDIFPTHKKIGGAPLNVAIRLNYLNVNTFIISKIGDDIEGISLSRFIALNNVSTDFISIDNTFKTGEVTVKLDQLGNASYDINYPVAWDKIIFTAKLQKLVSNADVLIYGSLVCRDDVSKASLFKTFQYSKYKVLDINLRAPFYKQEVLLELMMKSDLIKFNEEEIQEVCSINKLDTNSLEHRITSIANLTNTNEICVTRGAKGAILYYNNTFYYNHGIKVKIEDTVGAGDSFLAGLVFKLLSKDNPQKSLDFACALGSIVATKEGANPIIDDCELNQLLNPGL